ncbi:protein YgfX [Caballeronia ptereochthonis]|uniref:Lipoprotein n=1 Tax=Caballeronia ptereochthonis TaxID=1777144 RepID=A0A157Z995_9BURK|nr:protein YgfX [Caballeronia ptereochthonis]SAK42074.1 lipoprotein [Caballeronia ptereochthonis]
MAGARVDRPHRETGSTPGVAMRPSRFLRGAMLGFASVAGASVFQCAFAHTEQVGHAAVACAVTVAALGLASHRWLRARPAAISLHPDGLTLWSRGGDVRRTRIAGCAHWSGRLLALTLVCARGRRETLLVPADSVDADTFRQLAVQARRSAASHL